MDNSRWFNQADGGMNNTTMNNSVDLTLTLATSSPTFRQNATLHPNTQQGGVGATVEGQQSLNGSQTPYAWALDQMGSSLHNMSYANGFNPFSGAPSLGFGSSPYSFAPTCPLPPPPPSTGYPVLDVPPRRAAALELENPPSYSFAPTHSLPPPPPPPPSTGYTLLDVPPRRAAALVLENTPGHVGNYNDPNRRCTNIKCQTNDTPMWRKGPLGPKSLCNACGIKYRKEEGKKGKEARGRGRRSNANG